MRRLYICRRKNLEGDIMLIAFSTVGKKDDAERIAKHLIEKRIAACINVIKIENSFYRWKGKFEMRGEYLLIIKLPKKNFIRLETAIKAVHPYDMPELIAVKIDKSSNKYAQWVKICCP